MEKIQIGAAVGTRAHGVEEILGRAFHSVAAFERVDFLVGGFGLSHFSIIATFENVYSHKLFHSDRSGGCLRCR